MTVKGMMDLRLLAFRYRMACENKGTLNETMYKLNKTRSLGWEKRCIKILKHYDIEDYQKTENDQWVIKARLRIEEKEKEEKKLMLKGKKTV